MSVLAWVAIGIIVVVAGAVFVIMWKLEVEEQVLIDKHGPWGL